MRWRAFGALAVVVAACSADELDGADARPGAGACSTPVADDPLLAARQACQFGAGAQAAETIGLDEAARGRLPIEHIIVVMKENRSFDHLFGGLRALQPDAEVFPPGFTNPDAHGDAVAPFHLGTTCVNRDPPHQWDAMHAQVKGGAMDGFVTSAARPLVTDGRYALGYYDQGDLPFYYFLATTYAIADHYFPAVRSGTHPNRDYLLLGTSDKVRSTQTVVWPDPSLPTIFDRLDDAGVSWGVYADDDPLEGTLNNPADNWSRQHPWHPVQALLDDLAADRVPSVVFVDARGNLEDEHPTGDVQRGEAWTKRIYDAAIASPAWRHTVIFYTYDEAGGFFDHVPPPDACLARPDDRDFFELGIRVPLIAISPWARRHYVSKAVHTHTSITRFIEAVHGLPALTARDANSDALLDMFDFGCEPEPIPTAPAAGTGGCRGPSLTASKTAYQRGEPIVFTFAHGSGNPTDAIAVYPRGVHPKRAPAAQLAVEAATDGVVELSAADTGGVGAWPLRPGGWEAYFLADGYTPLASVQFVIQ